MNCIEDHASAVKHPDKYLKNKGKKANPLFLVLFRV